MKRYRHNRSNTRLSSFNMGVLVPSVAHHCVAGTTLVGGVNAGLQLAPMVHQALTQIRVDTWAISAADRLLWEDAELFYTGGETGDERPEVPYILAPAEGGWPVGSLADHFGYPTGVPNLKTPAMAFRLYAFWYNEKMRREGIQDEVPFATTSGLDTVTNTELLNINWPKDMFTTMTLEETIGDDVVIPLGSSAPLNPSLAPIQNNGTGFCTPAESFSASIQCRITQTGSSSKFDTNWSYSFVKGNNYPQDQWVNMNRTGGNTTGSPNVQFKISGGNIQYRATTASGLYSAELRYESYNPAKQSFAQTVAPGNFANLESIRADLQNGSGVLPGDFNFAMARAKWKSRRNLYGTRFKDLLAFWGIRYSDRRLQLPSTLSHGRSMVDISAVLQTAPATGSYVGESAGRGTSFASCRYKTYFEEPTTVIHLCCVRPAPVYVNMFPPEWDFEIREDIYTPEFAHVGMVAQKQGILFPTGDPAQDNKRMGFRNRYDEMRTGFNDVAGSFKTTNLSYHQGRVFETAPALNSDFLECKPSPRIFANMEGDQIEAAAIRNVFIEKNMVSPDGNPRF